MTISPSGWTIFSAICSDRPDKRCLGRSVKTICWCGKKATFNARFDEQGRVLKEGAQVVLGANDKYIGLCRRHWMANDLGPDFHPPL